MKRLILGLCCCIMAIQSHAYSYANAGKEPLLEAREAILGALTQADYAQATLVLQNNAALFQYLQAHHAPDLMTSLQQGLAHKQPKAVYNALNRAMSAEVERRLQAASTQLSHTQVAKVLVIKVKRYTDIMLVDYTAAQKKALNGALKGCLKAIANPGIFGVGSRSADPVAFAQHQAAVISILQRRESNDAITQ